MSNKISTITVVLNDVAHIRDTIESFLSQTWKEKELIIVDGGSTDGTVDIIHEYDNIIDWFCSEPDKGIYDAMNKGILHATGDWINILNSGDVYADSRSLENTINNVTDIENVDVIYGDSIERCDVEIFRPSPTDTTGLKYSPIYRHGSSLVRAEIHKLHLFDVSQKDTYGFALDWLHIHTLYEAGYRFKKSDTIIESFLTEGVSNNRKLSLTYNRRILKKRELSLIDKYIVKKQLLIENFRNSKVYSWFCAFLIEYVINSILPHIPFWSIRKLLLRTLKVRIPENTFIMKNNYFMDAPKLHIGKSSHINKDCTIDARGHLYIGNNVSVSHGVKLMTGGHDYQSTDFHGRFLPIVIDDYVWIGVGATVLQNVHIGKGAVICAGAVVTHDVEPFTIMGGIPARKLGIRRNDLSYNCNGFMPFT